MAAEIRYIITIEKETITEIQELPPEKVHTKIHERLANERWDEIKEYDWVDNPNQRPSIKEVSKKEDIFVQTVEELDIAAVIIALNKLKTEVITIERGQSIYKPEP